MPLPLLLVINGVLERTEKKRAEYSTTNPDDDDDDTTDDQQLTNTDPGHRNDCN